MARITERDLAPYTPKKDAWDKILKDPQKQKNAADLTEGDHQTKDKFIAFRVTESEYDQLMDRFGDPTRIRAVLLSEVQGESDLEQVQISERGDLIDIG